MLFAVPGLGGARQGRFQPFGVPLGRHRANTLARQHIRHDGAERGGFGLQWLTGHGVAERAIGGLPLPGGSFLHVGGALPFTLVLGLLAGHTAEDAGQHPARAGGQV